MTNKNKLKRLAVLDLVNKLKNSGHKEIRANTFDLFFASSRKWLIEFGMQTKGKGAKFPIITSFNGDTILINEYFSENLGMEIVIDKLIQGYVFLIEKYGLEGLKVENLSNTEKIKLLNTLYYDFKKLNLDFSADDIKLISKFGIINIPYDFKLNEFNVEEALSNFEIDYYHVDYLASDIKFFIDIMYNCYKAITTLNMKIDSKGISELRKYFTKNFDKFKKLDLAEINIKTHDIISEYVKSNSLERISFTDVKNIIIDFEKILVEVSL